MARFPLVSEVPFEAPVNVEIEWLTLVQEFEGTGSESRKQKRLYPRRNLNLIYRNINETHIRTLWEFYLARKGRYGEFRFIDRLVTTYSGEYVCTSDGSTTVWNLPSYQAQSRTLYYAGVAKTEGVDWNFTAMGGGDGEDKASLIIVPDSGVKITFDFTGQLVLTCRFAEDVMSYDAFYAVLFTTGLKLRGLLNS
jgi:hypothetical protein